MEKPEKNPLKIIWKVKSDILPTSIWILWVLSILALTILTFAIPDNIVKVNFTVLSTTSFITISVSALAFTIAMYSFGREVYSEEDLARLYSSDQQVYYGFLADYLFSALSWSVVIVFSVLKLMLIVNLPEWAMNLIRILYLAQVILASVATIAVVVKNMSRVTNKIFIKSVQISQSQKDTNEE